MSSTERPGRRISHSFQPSHRPFPRLLTCCVWNCLASSSTNRQALQKPLVVEHRPSITTVTSVRYIFVSISSTLDAQRKGSPDLTWFSDVTGNTDTRNARWRQVQATTQGWLAGAGHNYPRMSHLIQPTPSPCWYIVPIERDVSSRSSTDFGAHASGSDNSSSRRRR